MPLCRIFLKEISGIKLMGAGEAWLDPLLTLLGNWAILSPSHPCPTPIRSIPEISIKNILHNDTLLGHSSSLLTLPIKRGSSQLKNNSNFKVIVHS